MFLNFFKISLSLANDYLRKCTDFPNYKDKYGITCGGYANGACSAINWMPGKPGDVGVEQLQEAANDKGESPYDACCICGGGNG